MKEIWKCVSCGLEKNREEMTGNYHYCKECSRISKFRKCCRCKVKQAPEKFIGRICLGCKAAEQVIKEQRKADYEIYLVRQRQARRERIRDNEKQCLRCNQWRPLKQFYKNNASPDGKTDICKDCLYKPKVGRHADYSMYTPALLRQAEGKWNGIKKRCHPSYQKKKKAACYRGIENRLNHEEFIHWVIPKLIEFRKRFPFEVASVDRVDPDGHYELNNLRILSHYENSIRNRGNKTFKGEETLKTIIGQKHQPKPFNGLPPDWLSQFE